MNYYERLQDIWHQFTDANGGIPATLQEAVEWGATQGLIHEPRVNPFSKVIDDMRRALRDERRTDPMGRQYRANIPARVERNGVQIMMWAIMENAPHDHVVKHVADRRNSILADCVRLKTDVDVYNDMRRPGADPIQLILDFTRDAAEMQALALIEGTGDDFQGDEAH